MREDFKTCAEPSSLGHADILRGTEQNDVDLLNEGFFTCMSGHEQAIDNWHACSLDERLRSAHHVFDVGDGGSQSGASCTSIDRGRASGG